MSDGLVDFAFLQEDGAEVDLGRRVIWIDLQRLLEMEQRFVHVSFLQEGGAKIGLGERIVWIDLQGALIMGDGFVHFSALQKDVAEVVVSLRVVLRDLQRLMEMGDWPPPLFPCAAARCQGCCGLPRIPGRIAGLRVNWPIASSTRPSSRRSLPRS